MLHLVTPDWIHRTAGGNIIQRMTVRTGDNGGIIAGFGTAFDLQTVDTRLYEFLQMIDHAHISGVHNICTLFVLKHREILTGTLFLHQRVLIAAGLRTGTTVGIPPGHVIAEQTSAGIADAHGAVAEGLQLQPGRHLLPDLPDLLQRQFPGQYHPFGAKVIPRLGTGIVADGLLGGYMALTTGSILSCHGKRPQIRKDQCIGSGSIQLLQIGRQRRSLVVTGHGIHRDMRFHAVGMGIGNGLWQLLRCKITGKGAHTKAGASQIDRISTVGHGQLQPFPVPRRTQQLRFFPKDHVSFLRFGIIPQCAQHRLPRRSGYPHRYTDRHPQQRRWRCRQTRWPDRHTGVRRFRS